MQEFNWFAFGLGVLLSCVIFTLFCLLHKIFKQYSRNPPPKKCTNKVNDVEASNIVLNGLDSNGESMKQEADALFEGLIRDSTHQRTHLQKWQ